MILLKCKKGHFFDSDKFHECPYCAMEQNIGKEKTEIWSSNSLEETGTIWNKDKKMPDRNKE